MASVTRPARIERRPWGSSPRWAAASTAAVRPPAHSAWRARALASWPARSASSAELAGEHRRPAVDRARGHAQTQQARPGRCSSAWGEANGRPRRGGRPHRRRRSRQGSHHRSRRHAPESVVGPVGRPGRLLGWHASAPGSPVSPSRTSDRPPAAPTTSRRQRAWPTCARLTGLNRRDLPLTVGGTGPASVARRRAAEQGSTTSGPLRAGDKARAYGRRAGGCDADSVRSISIDFGSATSFRARMHADLAVAVPNSGCVVAASILASGPATVSTPVLGRELLVLPAGVAATIAVNVLLVPARVRAAAAPYRAHALRRPAGHRARGGPGDAPREV